MTCAPRSELSDEFALWKDRHKGASIMVLGLGESINLLSKLPVLSIGVNDIGRKFTPTYLLNVNNRSTYKGDRFMFIEGSKAQAIFTHTPHEQGNARVPIVKVALGDTGGVAFEDGKLPHFRNSPYMAVALAAYMGASKIGLLGVDFTDNHFWIKDGPHRLLNELDRIDRQYGKMADHLKTTGVELWNLSPISRLTKLPRGNLTAWY